MVSRLDRLFILLDTGSTDAIRLAAANQLGELQRIHPNELNILMQRLHEYSGKQSWETRVATGHAIKAIIKNMIIEGQDLLEQDINIKLENGESSAPKDGTQYQRIFKQYQETKLTFDQYNLAQDIDNENEHQKNPIKKIKLSNLSSTEVNNTTSHTQLTNNETSDTGAWPLERICEQYTNELFHSSWEIRHGAAIALREIIRIQGKEAGRKHGMGLTIKQNDTLNQIWLVDLSLKVVNAISLDKFGDFLFDQVVAPVRENCAQLLGCCFRYMSEENACKLNEVILKAFKRSEWEVRHGGVLSLKYCLSSAEGQLARQLLRVSYEYIRVSLNDPVDDVSAEAASALVPLKEIFIDTIPDKIPDLVNYLWNYLEHLDELSSSTSNIISLLSTLLVSDKQIIDHNKLSNLIPRLWPFISHPSTAVRISVLKALSTLLSSTNITCAQWMPEKLLSDASRLIFQRSLIENVEEIHELLARVWKLLITVDEGSTTGSLISQQEELFKATFQYLNYWISLIIYPAHQAIDQANPLWLNCNFVSSSSHSYPSDKNLFIASCTFPIDSGEKQKNQINRCRLLATEFLGLLFSNLLDGLNPGEDPYKNKLVNNGEADCQKLNQIDILRYLSDMFVYYIGTTSATQRIISGWTIDAWSRPNTFCCLGHKANSIRLPDQLKDRLLKAVEETSLYYDEVISSLTRLQNEAKEFVTFIVSNKLTVNGEMDIIGQARVFTMNQIENLCSLNIERETSSSNLNTNNTKSGSVKQNNLTKFVEKKRHLKEVYEGVSSSQENLSTSVSCSLSYALVSWQVKPDNINFIIKPLMDSLSAEDDQLLQMKSVDHLVTLILCLCRDLNSSDTVSSILEKLIKTACSDTDFDLLGENNLKMDNSELDHQSRIIYLDHLHKKAELATRNSTRRQSSIQSVSSAKSPAPVNAINKRSLSIASSMDIDVEFLFDGSGQRGEYDEIFDNKLQQRRTISIKGANLTLTKLVQDVGKDLPHKLTHIWKMVDEDIKLCKDDCKISSYELSKRLKVLEIIGPHIHQELHNHLEAIIPVLNELIGSPLPLMRHLACRCIGMLAKIMTNTTLDLSLQTILCMLEATDCDFKRCGAIEAIGCIIDSLDLGIIKLIYLLVVPVLRRMSDKHDQVRLMATHNFGQLVRLMPLDNGEQSDLNEKLMAKREEERFFIEQLLDSKKIEDYFIGVPIEAELRSYQQQGVNWLAFLNKYNLHGILCDEMGLGKTLMSICILAGDHLRKLENYSKNTKDEPKPLPSIVICPPTLTGHWFHEVMKFVPNKEHLNPIVYGGAPADRIRLRERISKIQPLDPCSESNDLRPVNLVLASYDMVRNDIEFFKSITWNYCILDEGHVIKNGKTKLSRAIRSIAAAHRLILSGTPIQNNVTELWSLFDFLMPGLLGSERQFYARYARPILQSRDAKCSPRDQEAGALAMESLHGQVLPFILRRKKEDVLKDLPPKIIQDYYCEMSPLQVQLYEDFTTSRLRHNLVSADGLREDESKTHVFQALHYLKNVCNHPKLVLKHDKHVEYDKIEKQLKMNQTSLNDIEHSSKLKALKQLLLDCGIGTPSSTSHDLIESVLKQHRALIFCQLKSMIDIIEGDLLKQHLTNVTYLRLDGSVPSSQRHSIVERFNKDPSIDVLLLTTQIGGLGLNLTGADTVIFVEHDWNPTKDLQAMDRAHRIGQKKVVNVYRLITLGTLEEKIMSLQKFKTTIANTVISQDNSSMNTMNVDQLFDLFDLDKSFNEQEADKKKESKSRASVLEILPELWDQQQYDSEYDLTNFIASLKG